MTDEWADTDEWPLPRYSGSSKVAATFHPSDQIAPVEARNATESDERAESALPTGPDARTAANDRVVFRDRGLIIAQQQTRIAQLEAQVARVEALSRWLVIEGHMTPVGARQIQKILDEVRQ